MKSQSIRKKLNQLRFSARTGLTAALALTGVIAVEANAGSWQYNQSIGGFNNVHIYTPDTRSEIGDGKALLVVLHGCTQSIDAFKTANLEVAGDTYGMVVAVPDAMNKAGFSCWSYWQGTKSRSSGDYKNLITLANTLSGDAARDIDANQVYIAGLSSGAAFANTTACLAPDVFAGMGISAGPSIGTSSNGAISTCESANVTSRCNSYAGSYKSEFSTQIASIAHGDADTTVNTCYNEQNANGMAGVYGVSQKAGSVTLSEGATRTAEEIVWGDEDYNRVSMLWLHDLAHAWSGGQGASGSYIGNQSINYASYLGKFFRDNNQRVSRNQAPTIDSATLSSNADRIVVTGQATDVDGSVVAVDILAEGLNGESVEIAASIDGQGNFSGTSIAVADDFYRVSIVATDNEGASNNPPYTDSVRVGPPPPPTAPVLSNIQAQTSGQCVTVSGEVVDINQDAVTVTVDLSTSQFPQPLPAEVNADQFQLTQCDLAGGDYTAEVVATDVGNLSSSETVDFSVDAGQTSTLDQHISAGRLDYTNYANCYLEYSTAAFRLDEVAVAEQCQWQDDDASCVGPLQTCSGSQGGSDGGNNGGGGDGDGNNTCEAVSAYNYYHKVAGRAYSTGNALAPDYFASGSDDVMPGSTWGLTTLNQLQGSSDWSVGDCP